MKGSELLEVLRGEGGAVSVTQLRPWLKRAVGSSASPLSVDIVIAAAQRLDLRGHVLDEVRKLLMPRAENEEGRSFAAQLAGRLYDTHVRGNERPPDPKLFAALRSTLPGALAAHFDRRWLAELDTDFRGAGAALRLQVQADVHPSAPAPALAQVVQNAALAAQLSAVLVDSTVARALRAPALKAARSSNVSTQCLGLLVLALAAEALSDDPDLIEAVGQIESKASGETEVWAGLVSALLKLETPKRPDK